MGFTLPNVPTLVAVAAIGVGLLFQVIGFATPGWYILYSPQEKKAGLWKFCQEVSGIEICADFGEVSDGDKAIRAFGVLGIFVMVGSVMCGILVCFLTNQQQTLYSGAAFTACLGAVFSFLEWAIFLKETPKILLDHLGYSFGLTIAATILCIIASVLFFQGRTKNSVSTLP